jgi:hypothetical protein
MYWLYGTLRFMIVFTKSRLWNLTRDNCLEFHASHCYSNSKIHFDPTNLRMQFNLRMQQHSCLIPLDLILLILIDFQISWTVLVHAVIIIMYVGLRSFFWFQCRELLNTMFLNWSVLTFHDKHQFHIPVSTLLSILTELKWYTESRDCSLIHLWSFTSVQHWTMLTRSSVISQFSQMWS